MPEEVTLIAPVAKPSQTRWKVDRITIDVSAKSLYIQLLGENGETTSAVYSTPPPPEKPGQPSGQQLLQTLNTANLTSNSLIRRVFNRLIADGYIAGTVGGTAD